MPGARRSYDVHLLLPNAPASLEKRPQLRPVTIAMNEFGCGGGASTKRNLTEPDRFHLGPWDEMLSPIVYLDSAVSECYRSPPFHDPKCDTAYSEE